MAHVRPTLRTSLGKWSLEVPVAVPGEARSVLRLIKSAGLGSCARGDTTDNVPHETQALELWHEAHVSAWEQFQSRLQHVSLLFIADEEVVCTKKSEVKQMSSGKLEMEIVLMWGITHTWTGGCFGSSSRHQQPFLQVGGAVRCGVLIEENILTHLHFLWLREQCFFKTWISQLCYCTSSVVSSYRQRSRDILDPYDASWIPNEGIFPFKPAHFFNLTQLTWNTLISFKLCFSVSFWIAFI